MKITVEFEVTVFDI